MTSIPRSLLYESKPLQDQRILRRRITQSPTNNANSYSPGGKLYLQALSTPRQFLDPDETTLKFRFVNGSTAARLDHSAYSILKRYTEQHNGVVLCDTLFYNRYVAMMLDLTMSFAQRTSQGDLLGMEPWGISQGVSLFASASGGQVIFSENSAPTTGNPSSILVRPPTRRGRYFQANESKYFELPFLHGLLGGAIQDGKKIPLSYMGGVPLIATIELEVSANVFYAATGSPTYTIDNVELNQTIIEVPEDVDREILKASGGKCSMNCKFVDSLWTNISTSNTSATITLPQRYDSLQRVWLLLQPQVSDEAYTFLSISNRDWQYLKYLQLRIDNRSYPDNQRIPMYEVNACVSYTGASYALTAELQSTLMKGVGGFMNPIHNTCIVPAQLATSTTASTDNSAMNIVNSAPAGDAFFVIEPAAVDHSGLAFSGVSTRNATSYLQLTFAQAPSVALNAYVFVDYDDIVFLGEGGYLLRGSQV